jgi:hypothetical protein
METMSSGGIVEIKTLQTTEQTYWKLHDSHLDYHEAFMLVGFFKNQGYAAVKIMQETDTDFNIYVLVTKGA